MGPPKEVGVAQSYTLVGQGTEVICEVPVVGRKMQAFLDTGASISMVRLKEFTELGFTRYELESSDLRIVQADERDIKISGMIYLPVIVTKMVTIQGLYVTPALCRSMILGRN